VEKTRSIRTEGRKRHFILAPIVRKGDSPDPELQAPDRVLVGFRGCAVFDYSQTDGSDLPTIGRVQGDPGQYQRRPTDFIAAQGIALKYSEEIAPARGTSESGKITLLPGMEPAECFATLVHECAHELLHRQTNRNETTKRQRETEAEAVAFVVCRAVRLETGNACQDYIQLHKGDAALLIDSLERVQSASSQILGGILDETA
jgi:hypothetical protein